jgi:hypothetical protein
VNAHVPLAWDQTNANYPVYFQEEEEEEETLALQIHQRETPRESLFKLQIPSLAPKQQVSISDIQPKHPFADSSSMWSLVHTPLCVEGKAVGRNVRRHNKQSSFSLKHV